MSPGSPVLLARGLRKIYRRGPEEVHALWDVGLSLAAAEVVAVVGPSGSGKTTLLSVLFGWEQPDDGEVRWAADPAESGSPSWGDMALVPQRLGLMDELSVRENVDLPGRLAGRLDRGGLDERADRLIRGLGLAALADRLPSEISVGEQQRAAVARALMLSPRVLLADEPAEHQDVEWAERVFRALRAAARDGTASLIATHDPESLGIADRVLVMRDGRFRGQWRRREDTPVP